MLLRRRASTASPANSSCGIAGIRCALITTLYLLLTRPPPISTQTKRQPRPARARLRGARRDGRREQPAADGPRCAHDERAKEGGRVGWVGWVGWGTAGAKLVCSACCGLSACAATHSTSHPPPHPPKHNTTEAGLARLAQAGAFLASSEMLLFQLTRDATAAPFKAVSALAREPRPDMLPGIGAAPRL